MVALCVGDREAPADRRRGAPIDRVVSGLLWLGRRMPGGERGLGEPQRVRLLPDQIRENREWVGHSDAVLGGLPLEKFGNEFPAPFGDLVRQLSGVGKSILGLAITG